MAITDSGACGICGHPNDHWGMAHSATRSEPVLSYQRPADWYLRMTTMYITRRGPKRKMMRRRKA